jgi:hypothetical protein
MSPKWFAPQRTCILLAALLLCVLSALAQDKPASRQKPARASQKSLPVSKYLRKVGLLYLQTIEKVSKRCDVFMDDPAAHRECSAAMERWDSPLNETESMVDIELSDSQFSGDIPTWRLLQNARVSKDMYLNGYRLAGIWQTAEAGKAMMDLWVTVYPTCEMYAHETVIDGTYIGDGGCEELIQKAMNHKSAPQTISKELRTKCAPFADGSADKVLAKTMPLPPKECREALGWMRDTRLNGLYTH